MFLLKNIASFLSLWSLIFLLITSCTSDPIYYRKIANNTDHELHLAYLKQGKRTTLNIHPFQEVKLITLRKNPEDGDSLWRDMLYIFHESDTSDYNIQQQSLWKFNSIDKNNGIYILEVDSAFFTYPTPEPPTPKDRLKELVDRGVDSLKYWGFQPHGKLIDTVDNLQSHWYLKAFLSNRRDTGVFIPKDIDYSKIITIRNTTFKKNWKIIIEQWEMQDETAANRWMEIINNNTRNQYTKPPKRAWQEGKYIYFVMATAAHDWFEYGDDLIEVLGRND